MESLPDKTPILVVDDDPGLLVSLEATIAASGLPRPALTTDGRRVLDLVGDHRYVLVLLDLIMPGASGMEILQQLKAAFPEVECVVVTAVDEVDTAVRAIRYGAYDYLVKPVDRDRLLLALRRALERYGLRQGAAPLEKPPSFSDLKHPSAFRDLVARDEKMARVFRQVEAAAVTDYHLLITGETGVGKDLLARAVHGLSRYADGPYVAVNVAASGAGLFEDDFFGHAKGAFTGAVSDKKGFFEAAQGGTIFLDEITELSPDLQVKLLRVVQEKEFYPLGDPRPRRFDARIVAASNRDIGAAIRAGQFREDLFHRLNMFHIRIPPLRDRPGDILPLARHFLARYSRETGKPIRDLAPEAAAFLKTCRFPGNVRELKNLVAGAVLMAGGEVLTRADLGGADCPGPDPADPGDLPLLPLAEVEKQHILRTLDAVDGNRTQAARILGVSVRTIRRKLAGYETF